MTSFSLKLSVLMIFCLALCAGTVGCKSGGSGKADAEVELFAKAQDLQKDEKFDDAIRIYRQIVREYPKSRQASNSQFMVGYIYANHIKDYEQAKTELQRFIDKFGASADSGLIAGAKFEMQYMGKNIDEIPVLSSIGSGTADTSQPATPPAGK
jgi:outer membrane protein assembly factor BamD (BamD/ComL family)